MIYKLSARYTLPLAQVQLHHGWVREVVIVDALIILNTKPTILDHSRFFNRFVLLYFMAGIIEVHLTFDIPNKQALDPKRHDINATSFTLIPGI